MNHIAALVVSTHATVNNDEFEVLRAFGQPFEFDSRDIHLIMCDVSSEVNLPKFA